MLLPLLGAMRNDVDRFAPAYGCQLLPLLGAMRNSPRARPTTSREQLLPLLGAMRNPRFGLDFLGVCQVAAPLRGDEELLGLVINGLAIAMLLPLLGAMRNWTLHSLLALDLSCCCPS